MPVPRPVIGPGLGPELGRAGGLLWQQLPVIDGMYSSPSPSLARPAGHRRRVNGSPGTVRLGVPFTEANSPPIMIIMIG